MPNLLDENKEVLRLYFADIATSKPLSRQQEIELATRIKEGDLQARDELVQANLRFVVDVAKNYQNQGLPFLELISAGNLGLMTAAERFDGARGFKFISYAVWWIRQAILQSIAEHARTVRLPANKLSQLKSIAKASRRLGQGRKGEPDMEEIAAELEIPAEAVLDTLLNARAIRSLDEVPDENDGRSLLSTLADETQKAPDADVLLQAVREQVDTVLQQLDEREYYILRHYFGLGGESPLTMEQIGGLMNLTRERVRQLKERALRKLREPERYEDLPAATVAYPLQ